MVTLSEENYLKAIYHLAKQENALVSTNAIAQKMQTKASSVTDMIKKLSEKGDRSRSVSSILTRNFPFCCLA